MPEYTLIYFNIRGSAELTRWICAYADIPFTDERIKWEDWPARKPSIPGGKLPMLMVDGKPLPESLAIARFMAKVGGLVPEDNYEAAVCDAMADTINDMMKEVYKVVFAKGDKEEQAKKYKEEVYPNHISPLLTRLEERFSEKAYFIANKMTWSDLMITLVFAGIEKKNADVLKEFPKVKAHMDKVLGHPKIKAWNDKQPETDY